MVQRITSLLLLAWLTQAGVAQAPQTATTTPYIAQPTAPIEMHTTFRVRYVNGANVYIEGGRSTDLVEGPRLVVRAGAASTTALSAESESHQPADAGNPSDGAPGLRTIAELKVVAVAETSAVCEVISSTRPVVAGDVATLPQEEIEKLVEKHALSNTRNYPAVVSFTEGDPMDEDVRDSIPRPPLPEVNRAQGRIGFDFSTIHIWHLAFSQDLKVEVIPETGFAGLIANCQGLIANKKPTRGAVFGGPSMNPSYTVGTLRSSLGISAWRNVAHRAEYE